MIMMMSLSGSNIFCGASLVTDRHLVTAAHCLAGVETSLYQRVDILMADYNTGDGFTGVRRKMARVAIHPEFNEETLQNDIAVITLRMSVNIAPGKPLYNSIGLAMTIQSWRMRKVFTHKNSYKPKGRS